MAGVKQCVYIDTFFIQAFLWGKNDQKQHATRVIKKIKSTISKNPMVCLKIPMVVIGELINNLNKNFGIKEIFQNDVPRELCKLLDNLKADLVPPRKETFYIAYRLLNDIDDRLKPTDALILSQAICDPDSIYLLTTDQTMLVSKTIEEYLESDEIKKNRHQKLRRAEDF